jgi:hypothetical protein
LRDPSDFCFIQSWPAFAKRRKHLSPVLARSRFDAQIVIEIAKVNRGGLAECHFGRYLVIPIADAFTMLFEKFSELRLRGR